AAGLNGLVSCSEWSGVRLRTLLDEAGVGDGAKWVIAEGADAAAMSRSVPIEKCMDATVVALYQNGEAIRSESHAPPAARLRGQHAGEMAAPVECYRRTRGCERRDGA